MKKTIVFLLFIIFAFFMWAQSYYGTIYYGDPIQVNDIDTLKTEQIHPSVVINKLESGDIVIYSAWEDDRDGDGVYDIYYSVSTDTGRTFLPDINLTDSINSSCRYPTLASDTKGNVFIVFQALESGTWEIYITKNTGSGFSSPVYLKGVNVNNSLNSDVNFGPQPIVLCDSKSNNDTSFVYVLFQNESGINTNIVIARSISMGDSFEFQGNVNQRIGANRHPNGFIDNQGNLHIVYEGGSGTNLDPHPDIFYAKSEDRGENFSIVDVMVNDNPTQSVRRLNPICLYDETLKRVYVAWEDSRQPPASSDDAPRIFMAFADSSSPDSFQTNIQIDIGTGNYNFRPSLSIDYKGNLVTAWYASVPSDSSLYKLYMNVYNDSMGALTAEEFVFTNAGNSAANFGNNFYRPALMVDQIDSVPVFYVVWRDMGITDDSNGDIFFVKGIVMSALADIDIDNDYLDVNNNVIDFDTIPAGPAYIRKYFSLVCTNDTINPDSEDGPGNIPIDSIKVDSFVLVNSAGNLLNNYVLNGLPASMQEGDSATVELILYIPEGFVNDEFNGALYLSGVGENFIKYYESVNLRIHGGNSEDDYDSLKIFPNPVRVDEGQTTVYFYGITQNTEIRIMDYAGHTVFREMENNGDGLISVDVSDFKSGLYFYVIYDGVYTHKGKLSIIK